MRIQSHYQKVQQRSDRKLILNRMKSITFLRFKNLNLKKVIDLILFKINLRSNLC